MPSLSFNFATRLATLPPVAAAAGTTAAALSRIPIFPAAPSAAFEQLMKNTGFASAGPPTSPGTQATSPGTQAVPHCICPACYKIPETIYRDKPEHFVNLYTISTGNKIPETVTEAVDNSTTHTLGIALEGKIIKKKVTWTGSGTGSITDEVTHSDSSTWATSRMMYNLVN